MKYCILNERGNHVNSTAINTVEEAEKIIQLWFDEGYGYWYTIVDHDTHEPVKEIEYEAGIEIMMRYSNEVPTDWPKKRQPETSH